jgi:nucleotide-binding universal stress UspA family protein
MIRNILVPLDGSAFGEQALTRAITVARRHGATIHLVHVHGLPVLPLSAEGMGAFDPDWPERQRADEAAYLEQVAADRVRHHGEVVVRLLEAPIADALSQYIAAESIDLVVMTTHGRGGISRAWLGSVADELVRATTVPLMLIRPTEDLPIGAISAFSGAASAGVASPTRVLLPLDGSPLAEAAIEPTIDVLGGDAQVTLLHVIPPMYVAGAPYGTSPATFDAEAHAAEQSRAGRYLTAVAERLRPQVAGVTGLVVTHAQPATAVRETARNIGADLTALATHGRSGAARWALGSVADKLIRAGDTPVLVVRPHAAGERRTAAREAAALQA